MAHNSTCKGNPGVDRARVATDPKEAPNGLVEALYTEGQIYNQRADYKLSLPVFAEAWLNCVIVAAPLAL